MSIASRIRLVLGGTGLSIKDFAKKCGIPYSSLQNYLRGERQPNADALILLNARLGISIDWILTGQGDMRQEAPGLDSKASALLSAFQCLNEEEQSAVSNLVDLLAKTGR